MYDYLYHFAMVKKLLKIFDFIIEGIEMRYDPSPGQMNNMAQCPKV